MMDLGRHGTEQEEMVIAKASNRELTFNTTVMVEHCGQCNLADLRHFVRQ